MATLPHRDLILDSRGRRRLSARFLVRIVMVHAIACRKMAIKAT